MFRTWNSFFYYSRSQKDWSIYILFCWCYQLIHMCSACCAKGKLILRVKAEFLTEEPRYLSFPLFCAIPLANCSFICHGRKHYWVLTKFPIQSLKHIEGGIFTFGSPGFKVWVGPPTMGGCYVSTYLTQECIWEMLSLRDTFKPHFYYTVLQTGLGWQFSDDASFCIFLSAGKEDTVFQIFLQPFYLLLYRGSNMQTCNFWIALVQCSGDLSKVSEFSMFSEIFYLDWIFF